jgi:hypothetical protein
VIVWVPNSRKRSAWLGASVAHIPTNGTGASRGGGSSQPTATDAHNRVRAIRYIEARVGAPERSPYPIQSEAFSRRSRSWFPPTGCRSPASIGRPVLAAIARFFGLEPVAGRMGRASGGPGAGRSAFEAEENSPGEEWLKLDVACAVGRALVGVEEERRSA